MAVLIRKKSGSPIAGAEKLSSRIIAGGDSVNTKIMDWYEQVIDTTLNSGLDEYKLPSNASGFTPNADVSWGDGVVEAVPATTAPIHSYSSSGTYNVRVVGNWRFGKDNSYGATNAKITDVLRFGELGETGGVIGYGGCFRDEDALANTITATDQIYVSNILTANQFFRDLSTATVNVDWFMNWTLPSPLFGRELFNNFKGLTGSFATTVAWSNMRSFAQGMSNANPNVTNWDVSSVGDARGAFISATNFTGVGLPGWDVSNMGDMYLLLRGCSINQDLSSWQFDSMTEGRNMFANQQGGIFNCGDTPATSPTSPGNKLLTWNFPIAVNMSSLFSGNSGFNQNMPRVTTPGSEAWDFPSTLTTIGGMFQNCTNFNGDIDNWNVSEVRTFSNLFSGATNFDRDLSAWNVGNATSMASMFQNATNWSGTGISGWNTANNTNLARTFAGTTCNPDITAWNTGKVTTIYQMAYALGANFTRDLSGWDTSSLTAANIPFYFTNINFSFGDWNLQNVTTILQMAVGCSLLTDANVADSLEGWYTRGAAPNTGVNAAGWCGATGASGRSMTIATYPNAKTAYDALIATVVNLTSGTNTSITTSKLVDLGADFVTDGVTQYDWVRNTTSGETAIVTAVDNLTTLSLTKDIFKGSPATYEIGRGYGWDMTNAITWV